MIAQTVSPVIRYERTNRNGTTDTYEARLIDDGTYPNLDCYELVNMFTGRTSQTGGIDAHDELLIPSGFTRIEETPAPPAEIAQTVSTATVGGYITARINETTGEMTTPDGMTGTLDRNTATGCYGERDLHATINGRSFVAWMVPTNINGNLIQPVTFWPATPNDAPTYANLPAMGGGAHTAQELTRATSQKRDNQRAERNAIREAYDAHAMAQMTETHSLIEGMGFQLVSSNTVGETPVTMWSNRQATVKITPYTIRIYNATTQQRLPKHGDAELVNRMEHGWCQRGEATGYAAGIVAALLPLIETPDPYMQALDAMEDDGREIIDQTNLHGPARLVCRACDNECDVHTMYCCDLCGSLFCGQHIIPGIIGMTCLACRANAYTLAMPSHEGGMQPIMAVSRYDLPAISGGSQENEKHALFRRWMSYPDARHIPDASNEAVLQQARAVRTDMLAYESANPGAWTAKQLEGFTAEVAEIDERLHLYPTISGGSQDIDASALHTPSGDDPGLSDDDPEYGYCVSCGAPAVVMCASSTGWYAYCEMCRDDTHGDDLPAISGGSQEADDAHDAIASIDAQAMELHRQNWTTRQPRTTSRTLNALLDERDTNLIHISQPSVIDVLNRQIDGAHRDLAHDRKPWPAHLCPACLATIEPSDNFCQGCGSPTNDVIAQILRAPFPGILDAKMRQKGRKEFAAAVRSMLKWAKVKGVSVTAPNYSMASSIDVRINHPDYQHPFDERFRCDEGIGYPMTHQHRTCPRCQRIHNAEHKLEQMILCAFPDCDDRSDSQSDYFDYRFSVHAQ